MKTYIVTRTISGTQTFIVKAKSKKEAKLKVDTSNCDGSIDFAIDKHSKAKTAIEDAI